MSGENAAEPGAGLRSPEAGLRSLLAPNPTPFTLDGTRTYLVGRAEVAVIDPGPASAAHSDAIAAAIGGVRARVLVTHHHRDHAGGAAELGARLGTRVRAARDGTLRPGDVIATDAGELVAVHTPGHSPDHFAFHWPAAAAVFCGDLLLGGQPTTLVAAPEGNLTDYLASLARVRALAPRVLYPAHGPPFNEPETALDAYLEHRRQREQQVVSALEAGARDVDAIVGAVYGAALDTGLRRAVAGAVVAYLEHLARAGKVRRSGEQWELR